VTDRIRLDDLTSDQLDGLYRERDEARQHAAAIASQRDRLRQRMNNLADRWDNALAPDKAYARTLRAEISVAPFDPEGAMTVQEYTERGRRLWAFRCWGTETCDGWLGLGHHTQTSALLERERHVAEEHADPSAEARLSHLQATSEAAGILLTRTTDERDQMRAAIARVRALHHDWEADPGHCAHCQDGMGTPLPWPCPTIRALDKPATGPAATQATDGAACGAYQPPTKPEDTGLCARCGMADWKHRKPRMLTFEKPLTQAEYDALTAEWKRRYGGQGLKLLRHDEETPGA
jgi:hypothetical protein